MGALVQRIANISVQNATRPGWQRHHLIPRDIERYPDLQRYLFALKHEGFHLGDFVSNGIYLPSDEKIAVGEKLPLHHGPHRYYNDIVIGALARIKRVSKDQRTRARSISLIKPLQDNLREQILRSAVSGDVYLGSSMPFGPTNRNVERDDLTKIMFERTLKVQNQARAPDIVPN